MTAADRLAEIRAREALATDMLWFASADGKEVRGRYDGTHSTQVALTHRRSDAEFIAHARGDVRCMADALAAVLAQTYQSDDGTEYEHSHDLAESPGEPECPACWAGSLRGAITEALGGGA